MAKKKRLECAICGKKMEFAYTCVLYKSRVQKVCSENCFKVARKYAEENDICDTNINRSIASYRVR